MSYADPAKQREYQREWVGRRRSEWFADKACVDCGATEDLELDHRNPEERVSHRIWSWSEKRRQAEIVKCDVRCRSCHSARHAQERRRPHGSKGYERGCRCQVCKATRSRQNARYNARYAVRHLPREQQLTLEDIR